MPFFLIVLVFGLQLVVGKAAFGIGDFFSIKGPELSCESSAETIKYDVVPNDSDVYIHLMKAIALDQAESIGAIDADLIETVSAAYQAYLQENDSIYYFGEKLYRLRGDGSRRTLSEVPKQHHEYILKTLFGKDLAAYNEREVRNHLRPYAQLSDNVIATLSKPDVKWILFRDTHPHPRLAGYVLQSEKRFLYRAKAYDVTFAFSTNNEMEFTISGPENSVPTAVRSRLERVHRGTRGLSIKPLKDHQLIGVVLRYKNNFDPVLKTLLDFLAALEEEDRQQAK